MVLATLCYVQKEDKVLLINFTKEGMSKGKWNGVGGKINPGESPEEAVIREVKEETGLTIYNPKLKGILTFPEFFGQDEEGDWRVFVFTATEFEGKYFTETHEGKLVWVKIDKVLELNVWRDDHIWFPLLKQERFFTGKFRFNERGEIIEHSIALH